MGEREPDWFMMFPEHYTWSAATLMAVASACWGGGEIGEIHRVCAALRLRLGDNAAWFEEWRRMGERVALLGEQAEKEGHSQTASHAFIRAALYLQIGERLLQPRTAESQEAYARAVALFKRGAPHVPFLSVEPVEVPLAGGKSLPAYFVKRAGADGVRWPTVVFFDGFDVTKEMIFLYAGTPELMKRGMAALLIDGPGNGESIRFRGMPLRYDYEVAGSAAIDYLETRGDVEADRIGVMGISLGGYYASRCAAFERRFKAAVAWGAIYDYHATWKGRLEGAAGASVPPEHFRWGRQQLKWILEADSEAETLRKLEKFSLKGVAGKIQCPFLLTHAEADTQISLETAQKLFAEVGSRDKTLRIFTREEGGAQHCMMDNRTIGVACITDWLADRLTVGRR